MKYIYLYIVIGFCVGVLFVCTGAWLQGFDFNERSDEAASVFMISLLIGGIGMLIGGAVGSWMADKKRDLDR